MTISKNPSKEMAELETLVIEIFGSGTEVIARIDKADYPDWDKKCDERNLCRICKTPLRKGQCPACAAQRKEEAI